MAEGIRRELSALLGGEYVPIQTHVKHNPLSRRRVRHWFVLFRFVSQVSNNLRHTRSDVTATLLKNRRSPYPEIKIGDISSANGVEDSNSLDKLGSIASVKLERDERELINYITERLVSKNEALHLLHSCKDFDYRFPVVWDRYDYKNTEISSLERLKALVYGIIEIANPSLEIRDGFHAYSYEQNALRREIFERQFDRDPIEVEEEAKLISEVRKVQGSQQILSDHRDSLYATLNIPSTVQTAVGFSGSQGLHSLAQMIITSERVKRRPISSGATVGESQLQLNVKKQKPISTGAEKYGLTVLEKSMSGVGLRSQRALVGKGSAQKIISLLSELKISNTVAFPTTRTAQGTDSLNRILINLLDAKKILERLEIETKVELTRLA